MANSTGLNPLHVRDYIVRPTLTLLALPSSSVAERLILGTAAQESRFRHLHQLGTGPALGLWQMEPATFNDLWNRFVIQHPMGREVQAFTVPHTPPLDQLVWNLRFACAMCRVHYFMRPFTMPTSTSPETLARVWKEHYNTRLGAGKPEEFVKNYKELVEPIYL